MNAALARAMQALYVALLRLYPPSYRDEFETEMSAVLGEALEEARAEGVRAVLAVSLREVSTLPRALWRAHRVAYAAPSGMPAAIPAQHYASWPRASLAALPLMLIGVGSILATYLPYDRWQQVFGVCLILALIAALGFAWLRGFPRWSYPYVIPLAGITLLGLFMAAVTGDMLNLVVPASILVTASIAVRAGSLSPLKQLARNLWEDWTLLAFGMYGLLGVGIAIAFDDGHLNNLTPYYVAAVVAGIGGGLLYLRSPNAWQRMASLTVAATLVVLMGALDQIQFAGPDAISLRSHGWLISLWALHLLVIAGPALLLAAARPFFNARHTG